MATNYKILGQLAPNADTNTIIYTVPSQTNTVVSTINVCNPDPIARTFRIGVVPSGETITQKCYIAFDTAIPATDSISLTMGITLADGDFIVVRSAGTSTISYNIFGSEIN